MVYLYPAAVGLIIAGAMDLRKREIHPLLTYSMIYAGLFLHLLDSVLSQSAAPFLIAALSCALCFVFAYLLYRNGVWAGGDVKLFTALGAVLPVFVYPFFPFLVLFAALLMFLPFALAYVSYFILASKQLRKKVSADLRKQLKRVLLSPFYPIAAYPALLLGAHWLVALPIIYILYRMRLWAAPIAAFSATLLFLNDAASLATVFAYLLLISALFFFAWSAFRIARKDVLRDFIQAKALEEGMIPAEAVVVKGKRLAGPELARGLTHGEIKALKAAEVEGVWVKKSIPFVPVLAAGFFALVFYISFL
jgi:preflagellin peptidase FlaK